MTSYRIFEYGDKAFVCKMGPGQIAPVDIFMLMRQRHKAFLTTEEVRDRLSNIGCLKLTDPTTQREYYHATPEQEALIKLFLD